MVMTIFFNVSRRFGYVAFQNYVPSSVTTMLSWVSFWIKTESAPARTSLGKRRKRYTHRHIAGNWLGQGTVALSCSPSTYVIYRSGTEPTSTLVLLQGSPLF